MDLAHQLPLQPQAASLELQRQPHLEDSLEHQLQQAAVSLVRLQHHLPLVALGLLRQREAFLGHAHQARVCLVVHQHLHLEVYLELRRLQRQLQACLEHPLLKPLRLRHTSTELRPQPLSRPQPMRCLHNNWRRLIINEGRSNKWKSGEAGHRKLRVSFRRLFPNQRFSGYLRTVPHPVSPIEPLPNRPPGSDHAGSCLPSRLLLAPKGQSCP